MIHKGDEIHGMFVKTPSTFSNLSLSLIWLEYVDHYCICPEFEFRLRFKVEGLVMGMMKDDVITFPS